MFAHFLTNQSDVKLMYLFVIPGFKIPNKFVYGYGLDLDEYFRNLPFIGVVDLKKI